MTSSLLNIDSRDRVNPHNLNRESIRVRFDNPITFRKISLIFMDMPNEATDTESMYYVTIEEIGYGCRGAKAGDSASFIQIKNAPTEYRSFAFENQSFNQVIDLGQNRNFTEFNIKIRYRSGAEPLQIGLDYSCIFRIHTD